MDVNYHTLISDFLKVLPFVNSINIIEGQDNVLYSSENWDTKAELKNIMDAWLTLNPKMNDILDKDYMIREYSEERLIATSKKSKGHILGFKSQDITIITHIEPDGIIPFVFREFFKLLDAIKSGKPYIADSDASPSLNQEVQTEYEDDFTEPIDESNRNEIDRGVPFTARLMAYYRALELIKKDPLLIDPYAERLAGDISFFIDHHVRYSEMDYPIIRSRYIEENIMSKWCSNQKVSQIVILGSGLDSRAYRFEPLKNNSHTIFEVDVPAIINYKKEILVNDQPLCKLIQIYADISHLIWISKLLKKGFSSVIPTFWLLEGLVYYIDRNTIEELLKAIASISGEESQIFVDILHTSRWVSFPYDTNTKTTDPFSKHFKWGLNIQEISSFFSNLGWNVSYSFADDHDMGRNVGQKVMVFIRGKLL